MKTALVLGAGGFIGSHMVRRLKSEGYWVRGADLKSPEFSETAADEFLIGDLRDPVFVNKSVFVHNLFDEVYQFAADMGGAGYINTGANDADVMHNSALININVLNSIHQFNKIYESKKTKVFYSSSACVYPEFNQEDPDNPNCEESSAYPAQPDSEYGWEKLFSERLYFSYNRNHGIPVRVARFHNIFGPEGTFQGGKEKSPAAICRKVALSDNHNGDVEVWGDGEQTRSFLYIDECIDAIRSLVNSDFSGPVNIGSEESITINNLVLLVASIANKEINIKHVPGPQGVRGRNSDNVLIEKELGWKYKMSLSEGIKKTYDWISAQL